jgi:hypothetical protein
VGRSLKPVDNTHFFAASFVFKSGQSPGKWAEKQPFLQKMKNTKHQVKNKSGQSPGKWAKNSFWQSLFQEIPSKVVHPNLALKLKKMLDI